LHSDAPEGELAIRRSDFDEGILILRAALPRIRALRYGLFATEFRISLAEGLAAIGQTDKGAALIDETFRQIETNGDAIYLPEVLRVGGVASFSQCLSPEWTTQKRVSSSRRQSAARLCAAQRGELRWSGLVPLPTAN
jgi:hypothetical protein